MALFCGGCKKLMHYVEFTILPKYLKCPECGVVVYEASDY